MEMKSMAYFQHKIRPLCTRIQLPNISARLQKCPKSAQPLFDVYQRPIAAHINFIVRCKVIHSPSPRNSKAVPLRIHNWTLSRHLKAAPILSEKKTRSMDTAITGKAVARPNIAARDNGMELFSMRGRRFPK